MNAWRLYKLFTDFLGRTPLHPQFFSKNFLNRQVALRASKLSGLVADLGCGFGPYKGYFAHTVYFGLDHASSMHPSQSDRPDVLGDLTYLPLSDRCLDAVLCTQVLEHVIEPGKAVYEIGRVLKQGGKLLLSAPFFYPLHDEPHDYFRYSQHSLKELLSKAGFEVMEIVPQGGYITMSGEFFNLFWVHKIQNLLASGGYQKVLGFCVVPVFLALAFLTNLMCMMLSFLDRERRFVMNYFIFAKRL